MQSADKEALTIEPWAVRIGIAALVLTAGVAAFTAWDRTRTSALEVVITPTAVGDTHFFTEPKIGHGPLSLKYQGQPLDMVSESKFRDSKLLREGVDDSGVYTIYRPADAADALPRDHYFVKTADNLFIEVAKE